MYQIHSISTHQSGFGASLDYYRKQYDVFSKEGYCVYGLDLLGFGGSEKVVRPRGDTYSARLWAKQVIDFYVDVVKAQSKSRQKLPILGGNSIGSRVALEAALHVIHLT